MEDQQLNERQELAIRTISYIAGTIESRTFEVQGHEVRVPREIALTIAAHAYAVCENLLLGLNREQRRAMVKMPIGLKKDA